MTTNKPEWEGPINQLACDMFDQEFEIIPENRDKLIDHISQTIAREVEKAKQEGAKEIVSKIRGAFIDYSSLSFDDLNDGISEVLADYLGLTKKNDQARN